MPVLLKMETDQLVSKKSFEMFSTNISWFNVFILILGAILLVAIIEKIIVSFTNILVKSKKDLLGNEIKLKLFEKMEFMEVGRTMSSRYKYISSIVGSDFLKFSNRIINIPSNGLQFFIQIIWITAIYSYFNIILLFIVIISSLFWYFISSTSKKLMGKYEMNRKFSIWRELSKYNGLFLYHFSDLAISWWVSSTIKKYNTLLQREATHWKKREISGLFWDINDLINNNLLDIILKLIVWYGVFYWTSSIGMVVLVTSSMRVLENIITQIFGLKKNYNDFSFEQETILLILKICEPVWDVENKQKVVNIEFKNIIFSYPNLTNYEKDYIEITQKYIIWGKTWDNWIDDDINKLIDTVEEESKTKYPQIFNRISFTFEKGKIYWIVGKNWAWKTTLMYLLSWFYRSYEWEIFINWSESKKFTNTSFLDKISFITQSPFLLDRWTTIKENIVLWVKENKKTEEKIWYYLDLFWLKKKIEKQKKWLEAEIGDDIEFSGWEKQIIALIRILLQDKDIIIMDEWTNQLDAENEVIVMNELLKQKSEKIVIFITHRMSTISKADIIYCLENWEFSHFWTHKELLKEWKNIYSRFYKTQILHNDA